ALRGAAERDLPGPTGSIQQLLGEHGIELHGHIEESVAIEICLAGLLELGVLGELEASHGLVPGLELLEGDGLDLEPAPARARAPVVNEVLGVLRPHQHTVPANLAEVPDCDAAGLGPQTGIALLCAGGR